MPAASPTARISSPAAATFPGPSSGGVSPPPIHITAPSATGWPPPMRPMGAMAPASTPPGGPWPTRTATALCGCSGIMSAAATMTPSSGPSSPPCRGSTWITTVSPCATCSGPVPCSTEWAAPRAFPAATAGAALPALLCGPLTHWVALPISRRPSSSRPFTTKAAPCGSLSQTPTAL